MNISKGTILDQFDTEIITKTTEKPVCVRMIKMDWFYENDMGLINFA